MGEHKVGSAELSHPTGDAPLIASRSRLTEEGISGLGLLNGGRMPEILIRSGKFTPLIGDAAHPENIAARPKTVAEVPAVVAASPAASKDTVDSRAVDNLKKAVVQIQNYRINSDANGSGFIVSGNEVITNLHVVGNSRSLEVMTPSGETFQAKVKKVDPIHDLAVLDVVGLNAKPEQQVRFGNSSELDVTKRLLALGHPNGQTEIAVSAGTFLADAKYSDTLTAVQKATAPAGVREYYKGIPDEVNLLERYLSAPRIVSDAPIDHGSSGGVLANSRGEVVGVTTNLDNVNSGRSYSVPGEMAQRLLKDGGNAFSFNYENRSNIEEHPWLYGAKDAGMVALAAKFPRFSMPAMGLLYGKDMLAAGDHLISKDGYGKTSTYAAEAAADGAAVTGAFLSLSSRFRPVGYALVGARLGMEVVQDFWRDKPHLKSVTRPSQPDVVGRAAEPFLWGAFDEPKQRSDR